MSLDLNLLRALEALLDEGSVTGAARRLHLTAPAVSRALARIRRATGDEILVRSGRSMVPTPYATEVRGEVRRLVREAQEVLSPRRAVDLPALERVFLLRWHDSVTELAGPEVLAAVRERAPGVRLRFLGESASDGREALADVDLGTSAGPAPTPDAHHEPVGRDLPVVVLAQDHPLARGALTAERYAAAEHVVVSRRGALTDRVDALLAELGLARTVVAAAPTGVAALRLALRCGAVATVPSSVAGPLAREHGLARRPLPLDAPEITLHLTWHRRHDGDPAHRWLRELCLERLRALIAPE
ncbi:MULTISPECIES: LysR family transcriptional regulator [Actinosynnema]|uniref:LysR family transcriptional regulator n=1 Tax=Actinosynnema TaxID=40566 RepID=UPI0020A572FD|nr:LysR family transcriptional regulator [Actinosynnema pretiosum]